MRTSKRMNNTKMQKKNWKYNQARKRVERLEEANDVMSNRSLMEEK